MPKRACRFLFAGFRLTTLLLFFTAVYFWFLPAVGSEQALWESAGAFLSTALTSGTIFCFTGALLSYIPEKE